MIDVLEGMAMRLTLLLAAVAVVGFAAMGLAVLVLREVV